MPRVTTIIAVAAGLGFLVLAKNSWGFSWATPGIHDSELELDRERRLAESLAQVATLTATALRLQTVVDAHAHAHSGGAVIDHAGQIAPLPKCLPCTATEGEPPNLPAPPRAVILLVCMPLVMRRRACSYFDAAGRLR